MLKLQIFLDKISDFLDKNNIPQHNENFLGLIWNEINTMLTKTIFWDQNKFQ